jgi:TPR repeat protein
MSIRLGVLALMSVIAGAAVISGSDVKAASSGECQAAVEFLQTQHDAGIALASYSKDEIHWALDYSKTQSCKPVPEILRQRMRGEPVQIPHHTRMNCHLAMDYLLMEAQGDDRFITEDEKQWARDYYSAVEDNDLCPAVPETLALRARGHMIEDVDMKPALAAAMDNAGDADAALEIAMAYFFGTVVGKDPQKGYSYLVKAQEMGSPQAEWELANLYLAEKLEGAKPAGAIPFLERAVSGGVVPAMTALGTLYLDNDFGVKKNAAEATRYYGMAAERGDINALVIYTDRLFKGEGIKANPQLAMELIRTAANAGEPAAMTLLASFTLRDKNTNLLKNEGEVWYWLDKARNAQNQTAISFYAEKADELEALYKRVKFPPPMVRVCPRVLKCDVYYYDNGRQNQKICSEAPDWRACRTVPAE